MAETVGLVSGLAQTVFTALQTKELRELCSLFSCEPQLEKLKNIMNHINAVLRDVDSESQLLTHEGRLWVENLKDVVYDIDDLLDEFATIGQQRKQLKDAKFKEKVGNFFSRNNDFFVKFNMSGEIKKLREKLDDITKNHENFSTTNVTKTDFSTTNVTKPFVRQRETCSVISELEVIGRDGDLETILQKLLPDSCPSNFNGRFVCIVGMGGLGKTTLAQLVYNNEKVEQAFSKRLWVCVSNSEQFSPLKILGKILDKEVSNLQAANEEVRKLLESQRFLLVLDDVWNESHEKWRDLMPYLVSDVSGSKIVVTSRSENVAKSIGGEIYMHKLQGLSEENSWRLFKRVVFETETEDELDQDLVSVAKDTVKKCVNVPLCIRVIASFLHDQPKKNWESWRSIDLSADRNGAEGTENSIMATLRFSYYRLIPELKSCFSFCSLFPKDYEMEKELLIHLWMAEGYLVPTANTQSLEDVGDQYFTILLNRCFFQEIELDEYGDVYSIKMHDLMHDLALNVAGKECLINTLVDDDQLGNKIRHLSTTVLERSKCTLTNTLRTYISVPTVFGSEDVEILVASSLDEVTRIISNCKRLRVLSLPNFAIGCNLPKSLGKLLHVRFLDLSENVFELLPKSITKLHNLQILKLCKCEKLKELPEGLSKLVNLRVLDIHECNALTYMPRGMSNLKNLHTLTRFVVGGIDSKQTRGSKLGDLQALSSQLEGYLCIKILEFSSSNMPDAIASRGFMLKEAHLKELIIDCKNWYYSNLLGRENKSNSDQSQVYERLVEDLCPNHDIVCIKMSGYEGTKLPRWATTMGSDMNGVQHVTSLSQFRHLKVLKLVKLENVEYIEIASRGGWESETFFPVLKKLVLKKLPKLKGWWSGESGCLVNANGDIHMEHATSPPCFPQLHDLTIEDCKSMTYFPRCPHGKRLRLKKVNEALTFCMKGGASSSNVSASMWLDILEVDNARVMNSVASEFVGGAVDIKLRSDDEIKSMGIVREAFERLGLKLKHLSIFDCKGLDIEDEEEEEMPWKYLQSYLSFLELCALPKMVKLPKGLHYLTSLQSLRISSCDNMEEIGECIGSLTSLQTLRVEFCDKLKALPECIGFLTSLQSLRLLGCEGIKSLPESMRKLTSLTTVNLVGTSDELNERCRHIYAEGWPKTCHFHISDNVLEYMFLTAVELEIKNRSRILLI